MNVSIVKKVQLKNIAFSSLNDNQFDICVKKGINHQIDDDVTFKPSASELRLFDKLNNAINSNAFDIVEDDSEQNIDTTIDCKYYSVDEFVLAKFNP